MDLLLRDAGLGHEIVEGLIPIKASHNHFAIVHSTEAGRHLISEHADLLEGLVSV